MFFMLSSVVIIKAYVKLNLLVFCVENMYISIRKIFNKGSMYQEFSNLIKADLERYWIEKTQLLQVMGKNGLNVSIFISFCCLKCIALVHLFDYD